MGKDKGTGKGLSITRVLKDSIIKYVDNDRWLFPWYIIRINYAWVLKSTKDQFHPIKHNNGTIINLNIYPWLINKQLYWIMSKWLYTPGTYIWGTAALTFKNDIYGSEIWGGDAQNDEAYDEDWTF